jgi:hypothetical protein
VKKSPMKCELGSHPPSLFINDGQMRKCTSKVTLKNALKVESYILVRNLAEARFLDGCAILPWLASGIIQDFLDNFCRYVPDVVVTSDIDLLCKDLIKHKDDFQLHRLVITGSGPVSS